MSVKHKISALLYSLVLILPVVSAAHAQTIAVLPLEDLSLGINSPNLEITRYIAERMKSRGLEVIPQQDIMNFMAANGINWLGYLTTENIMQARESMGADLVLLGTVDSSKRSSTYDIILNLVRTRDARTIWAAADGLSLTEMQGLLRLNQPNTLDELWPVLVDRLLKGWPDDFNKSRKEP